RSPAPQMITAVLKEPWITRLDQYDGAVAVGLKNVEEHLNTLVTLLNREKVPIESISINKPTLEDVFLHFTGRTIRDQEADSKEIMRMAMRRHH
ncbi:MAG TPA: DUF4162 domain-containing protein, partial [Methanomicrobiales archaeon]|nr:DUF4162 domain-containing protein [Methanomicrobiales archaeon]